jgi:PPOX class probable F420-dependent enzyme
MTNLPTDSEYMEFDGGAYIILELEAECVMFAETERRFVADARVGRLATVSADGEPHVIPVCHSFGDDNIVIALDEKPQTVTSTDLKRVQNIRASSLVSLVFDQYTENWDELGWVRVTGYAELVEPDEDGHETAIAALSEKYQQYADQTLSDKLVIRIDPHRVRSWGALDDPPGG